MLLVKHESDKLDPCTGLEFTEEDENCSLVFDPKLKDSIHNHPGILKQHAIPANFRELDTTKSL
jgi:hypothetical protein